MADHHFYGDARRAGLLPDHARIAALRIRSLRTSSPIREHATLLTPSHDESPTDGASLIGESRDPLTPLWGRPSFIDSPIRSTATLGDSSLNHSDLDRSRAERITQWDKWSRGRGRYGPRPCASHAVMRGS